MTVLAGIDYSMTSPSICITDTNNNKQCKFSQCKVYYLTAVKKAIGQFDNLYGELMPKVVDDEQRRYDFISQWAIERLEHNFVDICVIEGYAFGATGRIFNIAENTGLLKHKLYQKQSSFYIFTPTQIKQFAAGKGGASKQLLNDMFVEHQQIDIKKILNLTDKQWNPSSDIIDSYYICAYGVDQLNKGNINEHSGN